MADSIKDSETPLSPSAHDSKSQPNEPQAPPDTAPQAEPKPDTEPEQPKLSKAESNRRNAQKSTGPRTEQGKAHSRMNALKHGILASQTVIATIEGAAEREMFEQTVERLTEGLQPVGELEEFFVQQIATCEWRYRRLIMFENRTAFSSRDTRTYNLMNPGTSKIGKMPPFYQMPDKLMEAHQVCDEAGLGFDLPNHDDTMRIIRYEAGITRTMHRAITALQKLQKLRRAGFAIPETPSTPSAPEREPVIDKNAVRRDQAGEAKMMEASTAVGLHSRLADMEQEEREAREAGEAELRKRLGLEDPENDQTKPNSADYPKRLKETLTHMEVLDSLQKLDAKLRKAGRGSD